MATWSTGSLPPEKKRRLLQQVSSVGTEPDDAWVAEHAPAGIRTVHDLQQWPLDVLQSLTKPDRDEEIELRLCSHLLQGVSLYTDYSGLDCPREALEMGFRALQTLKGYDPDVAGSPVWVGRTCDKGSLQKRLQVALSCTFEKGLRCHFDDILHRLPVEGRQWIAAASPGKQASKAERFEAYKCIADWVMTNRNMLFSVDAQSPCMVHHRHTKGRVEQCPVHPSPPPPTADSVAGARRIRVCVAGVTCHAWSAEGSQDGQAHDSEIPLAVWLAERRYMFEQGMEDVCMVECTPRFPAQKRLEETFGDTAVVLAWEDGPEWHGWPHRRRRILSLAVNRSTADWFGPTTSFEARADYSNRFYRQMVSAGEILMQADLQERVQDMVALARCRKNNVDDAAIKKLFMERDYDKLAQLLLPPGGIARLQQWQEVHKMKMSGGPVRAFFCDVDHTVAGKGCPVGGELWPTQLTHGSVFALEGKEGESVGWTMATAREHMTALGWRAHGSSEAFPVSKMLSALSDLCCFTPNQVKTLAGNSMHLRTQMAFMFYALGHIMLKTEHPHTLQRASTWQWEDSQ
eukprot:s354_g6.t1